MATFKRMEAMRGFREIRHIFAQWQQRLHHLKSQSAIFPDV
jgi:hypothetical protein